ncbi:MAG: sigma-70 family RNA polymerase sigma factor [Pirellulaceae bacterium]
MVSDSTKIDSLLSRLETGDEQALAELFSHFQVQLRRMVGFRLDGRLQGRVDVSDVMQEVYLDAAQRLDHYRTSPPSSFLLWLRQLTDQRLVDVHRRHFGAKRRDVRRELHRAASDTGSLLTQLVGRFSSPSQQAIRAELEAAVEAALIGMPPIDREVLALRHFEELTNNEVADLLGISKTAASNRYVRALKRLQQLLADVPSFLDNE